VTGGGAGFAAAKVVLRVPLRASKKSATAKRDVAPILRERHVLSPRFDEAEAHQMFDVFVTIAISYVVLAGVHVWAGSSDRRVRTHGAPPR
jgi:hypothetical protein